MRRLRAVHARDHGPRRAEQIGGGVGRLLAFAQEHRRIGCREQLRQAIERSRVVAGPTLPVPADAAPQVAVPQGSGLFARCRFEPAARSRPAHVGRRCSTGKRRDHAPSLPWRVGVSGASSGTGSGCQSSGSSVFSVGAGSLPARAARKGPPRRRRSSAQPQHGGEFPRCLALAEPMQVGRQRHDIAAAITGGEVGPSPGARVDAERAAPPVGTRRIGGDPLGPLPAPIREPAVEKIRQCSQRRGVDAREIELISEPAGRVEVERPRSSPAPQPGQLSNCARQRWPHAVPGDEPECGESEWGGLPAAKNAL